MFYRKLYFGSSKYVFQRSPRCVCIPACSNEVQIPNKKEINKNYKYFFTSFQSPCWNHDKKEKHDQNREKTYSEETYFSRMLRLIPTFILVSLFGMHTVLCLKDSSQDETIEDVKVGTINKEPIDDYKMTNKTKINSISKEKHSIPLKESTIQNDCKRKVNDGCTCKSNNHHHYFYYPATCYVDEGWDSNSGTALENDNSSALDEKKINTTELKSNSFLSDMEKNSSVLISDSSVSVSASQEKPSTDEKDLKQLPNTRNYTTYDSLSVKAAIDLARVHINRKLSESGAPGITVEVTINGKVVWAEGVGFSDVENGVRMKPTTVLRIASISKALTATVIGQLIDEGKLDLDAPIQKYLPTFPEKTFNGEKVTITTRHLLTHTSGIRHYQLKEEIDKSKKKEKEPKNAVNSKNKLKNKRHGIKDEPEGEEDDSNDDSNGDSNDDSNDDKMLTAKFEEKRKKMKELLADKAMRPKTKPNKVNEFDLEEYYLKEEFSSLEEALQLFQDDELIFKPGTNYLYSSHGFTLVSAVLEKVAEKSFTSLISEVFQQLSMHYTSLDRNENIVYGRGRYYVRNHNGNLSNAPYVNNSYKWAGGGFLSNTHDLINFGNAMLYSYQNVDDREPKGILKSSTVRQMWTPSPESEKYGKGSLYGLGWSVCKGVKEKRAFADNKKFSVSHGGGAVGASSVLFIMPSYDPYDGNPNEEDRTDLAQGIVVAIVTNLQNVALTSLARKVANYFDRVPNNSKVLGNVEGVMKNKVYSLEKS